MGGSERIGMVFFVSFSRRGCLSVCQARSLQLHVVAEKLIAVCGQVDSACEGYVVVAKVLQPFWMVG